MARSLIRLDWHITASKCCIKNLRRSDKIIFFPAFFHKCENCITSHKICDRYFDVDDYAFLRADDFVVV